MSKKETLIGPLIVLKVGIASLFTGSCGGGFCRLSWSRLEEGSWMVAEKLVGEDEMAANHGRDGSA